MKWTKPIRDAAQRPIAGTTPYAVPIQPAFYQINIDHETLAKKSNQPNAE
jgi:hypothetical protein